MMTLRAFSQRFVDYSSYEAIKNNPHNNIPAYNEHKEVEMKSLQMTQRIH